jgi:hypothetical protein
VILIAALGCAHGAAVRETHAPRLPDSAVSVVPVTELPQLDLVRYVGTYAAQDAVWVRGHPVAVNRDFDFAIALGLDTVGAGIAASRRKAANAGLAEKLAGIEPIDPQKLLATQCAAHPAACKRFSGHTICLYGLLFGEHAARLRVVLELVGDSDAPLYVAISDARAIGEFEKPDILRSTFAAEIGRALDMIEASQNSESSEEQCEAGDSTHVAGKRVARDPSRVVLLASDPNPMLVTCASGVVMSSAPAPE